jgi:hypothetical protein
MRSCPELIVAFESARRSKSASARPAVITSLQKLQGFIKTRPECLAVADNDQEVLASTAAKQALAVECTHTDRQPPLLCF